MNDLAKAKIFISSVGQDELVPLRNTVFDELTAMGHEPMMYERNFGPWDNHQTSVRRCLSKVEESDIFLLFIKDKGGTFYPDADRTVTHMEYMRALQTNKTILVFVESSIKRNYFAAAKPVIAELTAQYMSETGRYPKASELIRSLQVQGGLPAQVDPYVWLLVDDLVKKNMYFEELALGVPIQWREYFSDLLRRGVLLLPLEHTFETYVNQLREHEQFYEFIEQNMPLFQQVSTLPILSFLTSFMNKLKGGMVKHSYGDFMTDDIGMFHDCSAITLYKAAHDRMILIDAVGHASKAPYYLLSNHQSYVAITYNRTQRENVFFDEKKKMFYLTIKCGERVMTCHFKAEPSWTTDTFMTFRESVMYGIMSHNKMMFEFTRKLIGGMQE
ncbi:DUF4062 domain-containing protein [Paenibacillus solisilvae]|uniref:DUF4062 domain-containing protein n=1 Tax=Paenibacillus solisilvae TaxID=2486751 RepID=A0ABW0VUB7_9BACL